MRCRSVRICEGAYGEGGLPAGDAPSHAGALHPLRDEGFVCGLDKAGTDGDTPVAEVALSANIAVTPTISLE